MERKLHSIRKEYGRGGLNENQMDPDPLVQLDDWLSDAFKSECPEPTAMVLSTAGKDMRISSRVVLMKDLNGQGITFFTNYESRKGRELLENAQASLLFFWPVPGRQVRIEGTVSKVSESDSDSYFHSRPLASRISAAVSPQSSEIPGRAWLEERWQSAQVTNTNDSHPIRPVNWGGYLVVPDYFEFWQGRESRLHDRIIYRREADGWRISRLAP